MSEALKQDMDFGFFGLELSYEQRLDNAQIYLAQNPDILGQDEVRGYLDRANETRMLAFVAKHKLTKRFMPQLPAYEINIIAKRYSPASFPKHLYNEAGGVSLAEIELEAEHLGVFEDLWPTNPA